MAKQPVTAYDPLEEEQQAEQPAQARRAASNNGEKEKTKVFSGFSMGLSVNMGYAFSGNPAELYRNGTLTNLTKDKLSKQSITLGAGVMGRVHLFDHMHVGAEGYLSTMPMMSSGSSIKHGYAGALVDGYFTWGNVSIFGGTGIGGGKVKRMYVPSEAEEVTDTDGVIYNASYTTTPFFYFDPYLGVEIHLGSMFGLNVKLDYLLPFGKNQDGFVSSVKWSNFVSPSGPRLHIGVVLGK